MPLRATFGILIALLLTTLTLPGCGREDEPLTAEGDEPPPPRLVTLAPSLTQMLVDLGQGEFIVGVPDHDAAAPKGAPVVGNFQNVNIEKLIDLRPTHVFTMAGKEGPPERLVQVAKEQGFYLASYPFPLNVDDVGRILLDEQEMIADGALPEQPSIGTVLDLRLPALRLKSQMLIQLGELSQLTDGRQRPRVLMVIGLNPVMGSGPGTTLDQLLSFAGGINAAAETTAVGAPTFDREKLVTIEPEVILLILPGAAPLTENIEDDPRLGELRGLPIPAIRNRRVILINDPLAHLPSTSVPRIAAALAKAIHPDLAAEIDKLMSQPATGPDSAREQDGNPLQTTDAR